MVNQLTKSTVDEDKQRNSRGELMEGAPSTSSNLALALLRIKPSSPWPLPPHWIPRRHSSVYTPTSYVGPPGSYGPFQRAPLEDSEPIFRHDGEDGKGLPAFSSQTEILSYSSTRSRRSERCRELNCKVLGLHFHSNPGEDDGYGVIPDSEKAIAMTRQAVKKRTIANKVRRARRESSMLSSGVISTREMQRALPPPPLPRPAVPPFSEPRMPQRQMTLTFRPSPAPEDRWGAGKPPVAKKRRNGNGDAVPTARAEAEVEQTADSDHTAEIAAPKLETEPNSIAGRVKGRKRKSGRAHPVPKDV